MNGETRSVDFNWVKARSECSLEQLFVLLGETIDSDVKSANEVIPGAVFHIHRQARKLVVSRDRAGDVASVVFDLVPGGIAVIRKEHKRGLIEKDLFRAVPRLDAAGECFLDVDGEPLRLWQVSRRALEDLFFA